MEDKPLPEGPLVGKVVKVKKDFAHRLLISVFSIRPAKKNSQKIVRNLGSQKIMRILLFLGFGLQGHQNHRIVKNLMQKK